MKEQPKEFSIKSNKTKDQFIKAIMDQEYDDILHLPADIARPGYVYAIADLSRSGRLRQLFGKGWKFVPADRHPELAFNGLEAVEPRTANIIFMAKNMVLMEREAELCKIEQRELDKKHAELLRSSPGLQDAPYRPQINSKTYTKLSDDTFGRDASFG